MAETAAETSSIKERPILFSGEMIRAILGGRKVQTRRVIKLPCGPGRNAQGNNWSLSTQADGSYWPEYHMAGWPEYRRMPCPHGRVGDRLWCRETYHASDLCRDYQQQSDVIYRADTERAKPIPGSSLVWKPSIFMPRWASRLTLEIVDIRVERVQDITEEDAIAEGIKRFFAPYHVRESWPRTPNKMLPAIYGTGERNDAEDFSARGAFWRLWNSINGKKFGTSWNENPWCWVISFRRIDAEILEAGAE